MAITIIFGKPRIGKTVLLTHFLNTAMYDRERTKQMTGAIAAKNLGGFGLSMPAHTVFANFLVHGKKWGYTRKTSYFVNPFKLGFYNQDVPALFLPPFAVIGITEGQKYFDSRKSLKYPSWQSRFFEQHGHNNYDIYIDVQRPDLIDLNIRELSYFIEIISKENIYNKHGKQVAISWIVRRYNGYKELKEGKGELEKILAPYNVHLCYNSQMCEPKFYDGHFEQDFDLHLAQSVEPTPQGYREYLTKFDDEEPEGFYQDKRSKKNV